MMHLLNISFSETQSFHGFLIKYSRLDAERGLALVYLFYFLVSAQKPTLHSYLFGAACPHFSLFFHFSLTCLWFLKVPEKV